MGALRRLFALSFGTVEGNGGRGKYRKSLRLSKEKRKRKEEKMKKKISLLLAVLMLLCSVAACGSAPSSKDQSASGTAEESKASSDAAGTDSVLRLYLALSDPVFPGFVFYGKIRELG